MDLPIIVTIVLFTLMCALSISFVLLSYLLIQQRKENVGLKKKYQGELENLEKELSDKLVEADKHAAEIIEQASYKAQDIIKEARFLSDRVRTKLDRDLEQLPKAQEDIYRSVFKQVGDEAISMIDRISGEMKVHAQTQVKEFGFALQNQAIESQKRTQATIDKAYLRVEKEIEDYKNKRLNRVDESIYQIIHEVSESVIGQAIMVHQHEELVLEALEEAKKSHLV